MLHKSAIAAFMAALSLPAAADTQLRYVDEKSGQSQSIILIADGKMRMEDGSSGTWTLFDADTGTFTTVNPSERSFTRMDEASMDALSGEVGKAMAEMRKQMEQMPPEQRAMMEKMMGGAASTAGSMFEMKVERTGKTLRRAGHDCEQVFYSVGSMARSELCVVPLEELDIGDDERDTLQAMQRLMKKFAERMSNNMGMNFSFDFDALGGMPVYSKEDNAAAGDVLKSIDHETVDASLLRVPEGYREEKLEAGEQR